MSLNQCNTIITKIKKQHESIIWPFLVPVDPIQLNLPDYLDVIKNPMDLGTIANKIKKKEYLTHYSFVHDLNLVWDNCIFYNGEHTDIGKWAIMLKKTSIELINGKKKKKTTLPAIFFLLMQ